MKFIYSSGQRPLDGYTLKRGVGKGGFGEVYFGLSDGGKEVALKLLQGNSDIELRGVAQCLNLKHPNLVSLFDLKTDAQGDPWVVMEYVAGETLNVVLCRHPNGLTPDLARQWFIELAEAVGYLHDHGIVHRDLKPGNIFLENNRLKIGDYGLCKFIGGTDGSRQSQSVGTVHYMAPEIATGNYNKQIDVYAAGIILFEMLTGKVPFEGESVGEILMKHLTAQPDLTKLPPEFRPVVAKALSKDPAQRYGSMGEMARAVEALGGPVKNVRYQPDRAPKKEKPLDVLPVEPDEPMMTVVPACSWRGQVAELCGSLGLATMVAAVVSILWAVPGEMKNLTDIGSFFFQTILVCWGVLIPAKLWGNSKGDSWKRRFAMLGVGALIGGAALWLNGYLPRTMPVEISQSLAQTPHVEAAMPTGNLMQVASYLCYFGVIFFAVRWWKMAAPRRQSRFSLFPILATGFWSLILLLIFPMNMSTAIGLIASAVIVQLVSPWDGPIVQVSRKKAKPRLLSA